MDDPKADKMAELQRFVMKHRITLGLGCAALVIFSESGSDNSPPAQMPVAAPGVEAPQYPGGGSAQPMPVSAGGGGIDMDKWRDDQRRDGIEQERRIDAIREEEPCRNPDGSVDRVSIHTGC